MGTTKGKEIEFDCGNDHGLGQPCNGHKLHLEFHRTSDTVSAILDGELLFVLTDNGYAALCKAIEEEKSLTS